MCQVVNADTTDDVGKIIRRHDCKEALASALLEGFVPDKDFLADLQSVIDGKMTNEEARKASLARALALDKELRKKEKSGV